jgi:hypothetical protein
VRRKLVEVTAKRAIDLIAATKSPINSAMKTKQKRKSPFIYDVDVVTFYED